MRISTSKHHKCVPGPLRECCSIWSGASGLPDYWTPLVCISAVIGLLAVWRHNKPKTKNQKLLVPNMKAWLATAGSGDSEKTWPPAAAREEDVRQQAKSSARCHGYFTQADLWRLNEIHIYI